MHVLSVSIPNVRSRRPDTGRRVAQRQAVAPTIQVRATTIAAATPKVSTVVVKSAAGTTTAVARLTATRAMIARSGGQGGHETTGISSTVWWWTDDICRPAPGLRAGCLGEHRKRRSNDS